MAAPTRLTTLLPTHHALRSHHEKNATEMVLFLYFKRSLLKNLAKDTAGTLLGTHEASFMEYLFVKQLLEDILSTEEYTLSGIAYHLAIPEELLFDLLTEQNRSPSLYLAHKIMSLHQEVRRDWYQSLMSKLLQQPKENEGIL